MSLCFISRAERGFGGTLLSLIRLMAKKSSYLKRLPRRARKIGDAERGEIEIVTSRRETRKIDARCAEDLSGSALGKRGKRLGILLEDEVRMIVRDPLRFPSGETKCQMRIIGKTEFDGPNGVAVLAVLDGRFVLREIFRHPTRSWELECVRGRREEGQSPRQAALAEVKQELGYRVKKLHRLGIICPETALMSSTVDVYMAELREAKGSDDPDGGEAFGRIVHLSPDEMAGRMLKGRIRDSYTFVALFLAQLRGLVPPIMPVSEPEKPEREPSPLSEDSETAETA